MRPAVVLTLLSAVVFAAAANAQTRQELMVELVRVQGLQEIFDETLEQSKAAAQQYGREMFSQMLAGAGDIEPTKRERLEAVLQRFLDRCAAMWKSDELLALWTKSYGTDLNDADLKQMLAYYKSPIGAKDVAAAKLATRAFVAASNAEGQRRMQASLQLLVSDIKAETGQ